MRKIEGAVCCLGYYGVKENYGTDRLLDIVTITSGLRLERTEVLRNLKLEMQAESRGHHTIDRQVERGRKRKQLAIFRETAIINETNIGTVLKTTW